MNHFFSTEENHLNNLGFEQYLQQNATDEEEVKHREQIKKVLLKALDGLTERQRQAVFLYYFDNNNMEETAKLMLVTKSTVSRTLFRARRRLEKVISCFS